MTKRKSDAQLTPDEAKLYDRQIRLWGLEAQGRMRNAKILLIGVNGLLGECAKNIVLAGIGHLTIMDSEAVVEKDLDAQFLLTDDDVGKNVP